MLSQGAVIHGECGDLPAGCRPTGIIFWPTLKWFATIVVPIEIYKKNIFFKRAEFNVKMLNRYYIIISTNNYLMFNVNICLFTIGIHWGSTDWWERENNLGSVWKGWHQWWVFPISAEVLGFWLLVFLLLFLLF